MRRYHLPKTWRGLVCAVAAIAALSCSASAVGQTFTEFPLPANSVPYGITAGPDGALWFTERRGIGRITTTGAITEFRTPNGGGPRSITAGPDGALWFTEEIGNKIGRITITGTITEFTIPAANSLLQDITVGPDGALWFTEYGTNKIGRITTTGVITEFPVPTANSRPLSITAGPDGALWFTENNSNNIGRITTTGIITEFPIPNPYGDITTLFITTGPDGALWFDEPGVDKIGRITTTGVITEFPVPPPGGPYGIAAGPDGALWFTENSGNQIGRLVPAPSVNSLLASTLPSSRSVQVGGNATAFALILNTGAAATGCGIAPVTSVPAGFSFQTTDPNTNTLIGTPNTRVPIGAGANQTFLVAYSANAPYPPTDVVLGFDCTNVDAVATIVGVNTLLLTFDANPVPDMIAIGLTPSKDGYSRIPGLGGTGIFVIASTNIGVGASLTARVRLLDASTPLTATLCETDPSTGQCKMTPAATDTRTINHNENTTWTAFLQANNAIAQDPARFRVMFEFVDANGIIRGSTSTAVTTQ